MFEKPFEKFVKYPEMAGQEIGNRLQNQQNQNHRHQISQNRPEIGRPDGEMIYFDPDRNRRPQLADRNHRDQKCRELGRNIGKYVGIVDMNTIFK